MRRLEYRDQKTLQWLHYLRNEELKAAIRFFPQDKPLKILEIGGGEGYIAKCISDMGYDITSIDVAPIFPQLYPVQQVDVTHLSFSSETFDLVFSCQVLQYIKNVELAFQEIKRVLKKNGIIIHLVPTTSWRSLTTFWHYYLMPMHIASYVIRKQRQSAEGKNVTNQKENIKSTSNKVARKLSKIVNYLLHPIGTSPTFIHEMYYFSSFSWNRLFLKHGFKIISVENGPYLYSGYFVFKMRFLKFRKFLAKHFFSTSYCFVLKT